MFAFFATIFSAVWVIDHLKEILIGVAIILALIIWYIVRNKRRRAAYLALPVMYVGNRETRTYHSPSCRMIQNANKANLVYFRTRDEVNRSGYKACGICEKKY